MAGKFQQTLTSTVSPIKDVSPAGPDYGLGMAINAVSRVAEAGISKAYEKRNEDITSEFSKSLTDIESSAFTQDTRPEQVKALDKQLANAQTAEAQGRAKQGTARIQMDKLRRQFTRAYPELASEFNSLVKDRLAISDTVRKQDAAEAAMIAESKRQSDMFNSLATQGLKDAGALVAVTGDDGSIDITQTAKKTIEYNALEALRQQAKDKFTDPNLKNAAITQYVGSFEKGWSVASDNVLNELDKKIQATVGDPTARAAVFEEFRQGYSAQMDVQILKARDSMVADKVPADMITSVVDQLKARKKMFTDMMDENYDKTAKLLKNITETTTLTMYDAVPGLREGKVLAGDRFVETFLQNNNYADINNFGSNMAKGASTYLNKISILQGLATPDTIGTQGTKEALPSTITLMNDMSRSVDNLKEEQRQGLSNAFKFNTDALDRVATAEGRGDALMAFKASSLTALDRLASTPAHEEEAKGFQNKLRTNATNYIMQALNMGDMREVKDRVKYNTTERKFMVDDGPVGAQYGTNETVVLEFGPVSKSVQDTVKKMNHALLVLDKTGGSADDVAKLIGSATGTNTVGEDNGEAVYLKWDGKSLNKMDK